MNRKRIVLGAVLTALSLFLVPMNVAAAPAPPVVDVADGADLWANILVQVSVDVTCAPRTPFTLVMFSSVTLEQAVGGRIASGAGFLTGVTCDNKTNAYVADIVAAASGAPFAEGPAIVTASIIVCTIERPDGGTVTDCVRGNDGPKVIYLFAVEL